jgi:hypothetical protein
MSGGTYDYAYSKVMDMADEMERQEQQGFSPSTPLRIAFRGLLERVGTAMKAVEWVDSGDCSEPHAEDAIRACFDYHPDLPTSTDPWTACGCPDPDNCEHVYYAPNSK